MNFSEALEKLKKGKMIARSGWNGKGMFLIYVAGGDWSFDPFIIPNKVMYEIQLAPFIAMKTADNKLVPWLASQTDILASDWEEV